MRTLGLVVVLSLVGPRFVLAGQVCLRTGTGKVLEYQSHATPGTCTKNLVNAGQSAAQIEERTVTPQEWAQLYEEQFATPAREALAAKRTQRAALAASLRQKLGLSAQEFAELKEALRD